VSAAPASPIARVVRTVLLTVVAGLAIALEAAPIGLSALALPSPDLVSCVVIVWVLRAPEAAPLILVFAIGVARDLLTDVPPGLGALSLVMAAELVRLRRATLVRRHFAFEWLWVGLALAAMMLLQWLGVLISLAQPPYLTDLAQVFVLTLALYPVVAVVCRWGLGLRPAQPEPA